MKADFETREENIRSMTLDRNKRARIGLSVVVPGSNKSEFKQGSQNSAEFSTHFHAVSSFIKSLSILTLRLPSFQSPKRSMSISAQQNFYLYFH